MRMFRVLLMSVVFLAGAIGTGLIGPNRSSIESEYGLLHSHFGLGVAVTQILGAVGVLLIAPRLQRVDRVSVLRGGLLLQMGGFLVVCCTRSVAALAGGWALITTGSAVAAIANKISMDLWREDPRRGVTLLHGYNAVGKVAGPLIAAACLALSWRLSFLAVGLVTALLFLAFSTTARQTQPTDPQPPKSASADGWGILRRPFYWLCVLPFGLIAGGEAAFATLMPLYFEKVRGFAPQTATLLLTIHLLGLVAGRFASAYLRDAVSNNAIVGLCLSAGVFVFPGVLADHAAVRMLSLFLLGLMFSSTWPTFYAQVSKHLRDHPNMLAYGSNLGNFTGISLCILLSSLIADYSLTVSLFFGPMVLWAFGLLYYGTPLSREGSPIRNRA